MTKGGFALLNTHRYMRHSRSVYLGASARH